MRKSVRKNKKITKNKEVKEISVNTSKALRRYIKLANLVPSAVEFDKYFSREDTAQVVSRDDPYFKQWAEKEMLRQYPKLFRYLSLTAKQRGSLWATALDNFKTARNFMKIFVEIAEEYQIALANNQRKEKKLRESIEALLKSHNAGAEAYIELDTLLQQNPLVNYFKISYVDTTSQIYNSLSTQKQLDAFRTARSKETKILAQKLYNLAFGFISLTVENNQAKISFGDYLDVIQSTDLRRLKRCVVCSNILWANPLNKKFCSIKCANVQLQRNLRANPERRAEINKRRVDNYKQNKKVKKLKEKKNGTL